MAAAIRKANTTHSNRAKVLRIIRGLVPLALAEGRDRV